MPLLSMMLDPHQAIGRRDLSHVFHPEEALRSLVGILNQLPEGADRNTSIQVDKDHFQAKIDVQQFKPEEITVKLNKDNSVTIEGKHEEKQDEHGFISRHFVRRYVLPEGSDLEKVKSSLSADGVLSISVPKKPEKKQLEYRQIPIIRTGPVKNLPQQNKPIEEN